MLKRPSMFKEAEMLRTPKNLIIQIIIFVAFFFAVAVVESAISAVKVYGELMDHMNSHSIKLGSEEYYKAVKDLQLSDSATILSLFATLSATLMTIFYCRCIECRPVSSIGMRKKGALKKYFSGIAIGFILMSLITGIGYLCGALEVARFSFDINYKIFFLYLAGFLIQGMSEEFVFRGYLMNSVGSFKGIACAIAVSSFAFSFAHLANPGISVIAVINLVLFGVFAAVLMIVLDDIWCVCGIHSMWNFSQGNIYGISVSGTGTGESLIKSDMKECMKILNGGDFGIEGGIITSIVLVSAILLVLYFNNKKQSNVEKQAKK